MDNQEEVYSQTTWVEAKLDSIHDEEQRELLLDKELASLMEERDAILNGTYNYCRKHRIFPRQMLIV